MPGAMHRTGATPRKRFVPRSSRLAPDATLSRGAEHEYQHRGLLLWAMQDPEHRSLSAVAAAVGRDQRSVVDWGSTWAWEERLIRDGVETAQARAIQLYRELYYPTWGMREVGLVEQRMSVPFLTTHAPPRDPAAAPPPGLPPESGGGEARRTNEAHAADPPTVVVGGSSGGSPRIALNSPGAKAAAAVHARRNFIDRSASLLEAMVGSVARQIQANPEGFKLKPEAVPAVLKAWREIKEFAEGMGTPVGAAGTAVEPSQRVQIATRTGGSILAAMREDAEEVLAVLRGMEAAERVAAELPGARDPEHVVEADAG